MPDDLIELGRIVGAQGLKGWIKVQPFSTDSEALSATKRWWISKPPSPLQPRQNSTPPEVTAVDVLWAKPHGAFWLASIKGCADRDVAQALKGHTVMVSRASFPTLDPDEYYWIDLIGCDVATDDSGQLQHLGVVESVQDNPAHPILLIRQQTVGPVGESTDRFDDKGQAVYSLVPFVESHVGEVDLTSRSIVVHWPADF